VLNSREIGVDGIEVKPLWLVEHSISPWFCISRHELYGGSIVSGRTPWASCS
jgi:hypothetical protein